MIYYTIKSLVQRPHKKCTVYTGFSFPEPKSCPNSIYYTNYMSHGSSKKEESSRKTSTSALLTTPKPLTVWITTDCGKFLERWEYHTTLPASWKICMLVKKQQLELDMEQQTGSKLGKEYIKAV